MSSLNFLCCHTNISHKSINNYIMVLLDLYSIPRGQVENKTYVEWHEVVEGHDTTCVVSLVWDSTELFSDSTFNLFGSRTANKVDTLKGIVAPFSCIDISFLALCNSWCVSIFKVFFSLGDVMTGEMIKYCSQKAK